MRSLQHPTPPRRSGVLRGAALLLVAGAAVAVVARADRPAASDGLFQRLQRSVGRQLDAVELTGGRRLVRPVLDGVTRQRGEVTALRLLTDPAAPPRTVQLSGVTRIVIDREVVYDTGPTGDALRPGGARGRDAGGKEAASSAARMRANGIEPWPAKTAADHAAEVHKLEQLVALVQRDFPGMRVETTHEFIFATDIPTGEVAGVVASLDRMHDLLCDLYDIPAGEPVWLGKCLVIAFQREEDFHAFGRRVTGEIPAGVHGACHQSPDGRVFVTCHKGPDQLVFEHMIVHETSHGFSHRWLSPVKLPNWLNEGIAEWIACQVVPACRQVAAKEAKARALMATTGTVGNDFFTAANIAGDQYGIASGLVRFMAGRDRRRFKRFVRGIKEGATVEDSLSTSFNLSLDGLLTAYAGALALPALTR